VKEDQAFLQRLESLSLSAALSSIHERLGTTGGTIHSLGDDGHQHLAAGGEKMPPVVLEKIAVIPVGKGMAGLAVERCEPVTACNLQTDTSGDVRPGALQTGLQGSIVVPILADGKPVGALGVANRRERTFTEEETELLLEIGRRLAGRITASED
jgi:L-methionine (R)-S-oxide reductase